MGLFLSQILQTVGHTISLPQSGSGSDMVTLSEVNAVLIDLSIPDITEILSSLASLRTRFRYIPILAIAREAQALDFLEIRMRGADDVLRYPFSPSTLLEAVERAMEEPI